MEKTTVTNIMLLFAIGICLCLLQCVVNVEEQTLDIREKTLVKLIVSEYKSQNKNFEKENIIYFVKNYQTSELKDLVYMTKKLPNNFTFESHYFDERDYYLFESVLEPIGYEIKINHRIEPGGFYKKEQTFYIVEINR